MDFDDADESSAAPPKPAKFLPKSRFQPKARPKRGTPSPKPEPSNDGGPSVPVKKEQDSEQAPAAAEMEASGAKSDISGGVDPMEVEPNTITKGEELPEAVEEDFVVREIDVYFNPSPIAEDTKLFVWQYPLRPAWRPYELDKECKITVKQPSTDVEIELPVDMDSENFDPDAPNAERFDKLILSSKWRPLQRTAYAIGVFTGSELHLNPVFAVRQLRPSMENLNPSALKKKNVSEVATKATTSTSESSKNPNKDMDQKDSELCIPLEFHDSNSNLSAGYRAKMLAAMRSPLTFPMKPLDYLDSLCPQSAINKTKPVAQSKRSLLLLPLYQRLKLLFTEGAAIHRFSALIHYAPDHPVEDVLRLVEQFAFLVQGNWVAKTAIRYPSAKGDPSLLRDRALCRFFHSTTVKHSDFKEWTLKNIENVWKEAFGDLAFERPKCGDFKFREPTDLKFIKQYPEIVEKYQQMMKVIEERLETNKPKKKNVSVKINPASISNQGPITSSSGAGRSMPHEAREALPKALRKLFQSHKVCSFQTICQGVRSMAVSMSSLPKGDANVAKAAAFCLTDPQEELLEIISEVLINIHGAFVLKSSSEHPELNPLRNVVIDLFIGKGPNAKVKKSEIVEAAKIQLKMEPSNDEFRKVVSEFCESSDSPLRSLSPRVISSPNWLHRSERFISD